MRTTEYVISNVVLHGRCQVGNDPDDVPDLGDLKSAPSAAACKERNHLAYCSIAASTSEKSNVMHF